MDESDEEFLKRLLGSRVNQHPTRVSILRLFSSTTSPLSASEIAEALELPVAKVRYHLGVLESIDEVRLVGSQAPDDGTERRYSYR
jgi:predicted ArsR family transcriptional regulator